MLKYTLTIIIALFIGLVIFIDNSQGPPANVGFTMGIVDSLKTLDPAVMSLHTELEIAIGLWEGLFTYNPENSEPMEGVAYYPADVENNYQSWTFHLREDAKWSNGDPVTADDFIYGWRRAIEPGTANDYTFLIRDNIKGASEYVQWRNDAVRILGALRTLNKGNELEEKDREFLFAQNLPGLNGEKPNWMEIADKFRADHLANMEAMFEKVSIKAPDKYTLKVELNKSLTYFEDLMPFATFAPIHRESIDMLKITDDPIINYFTLWVYDPQWVKPDYHKNGYPGLVSNGPFKMSEWKFKDYMYFERNENYWDVEAVKNPSYMVKIISESNSCFMAFENGKIDYIESLAKMPFISSLIKAMKRGERDDIHTCDAWGTFYFQFNCADKLNNGADNPLKNKKLRMALNLAVNKQAIIDAVLQTGNTAATLMVPPNIIDGYNCPPGPAYNPERARELLAEAGYPNGEGLPTIELYYSTKSYFKKICEAISEMWKTELGINASLKGTEWKIFDADRQEHEFMICRAGWYGDYPDPTTFLDLLKSDNPQNFCSFSNAEYDRLLEEASECKDPAKRLALLAQAEEIITHDEVPIMPIYYYINIEAFRPEIKGLFINANQRHPVKYIYNENIVNKLAEPAVQ